MSNATSLLQHHLNKFGVVTVMDVLMRDTSTKEPILSLDTLKITSLNQEGQQKEIRGGIGAPELISYDFARTISVEIQDALASMASLQLLWGGKFIKDSFDYTAVFEGKIEDGAVAIPEGIEIGEKANLSQGIAIGAEETFSLTKGEGKVTLGGGTPKNGDIVKVFLPAEAQVNATKNVAALAINSVDLPPTVHLTGTTFFIDQATGKKIVSEIEIPLFKLNIGGGLTMEAEGDAAVFDFSGKALKDPITKNFFVLKQLGEQKE